MKPNDSNFLLLSSALLLMFCLARAATTDRDNFLSHGPGAAASALGEAFTAVSDDATAIYYNPAGLALQRGSVYAEHTPVFGGGRYNFIGFNYPLWIGSFGLGVIQFATGDIQTRKNIGDAPVEASADQTAWFVPFSTHWKSLALGEFAVGTSIKKVDQNLAGAHDSGLGVDVGALYSKAVNDFSAFLRPNFRVGVSIKNLVQPSLSLQSGKETFPTNYKLGSAVSGNIFPRFDAVRNRVVTDKVSLSVDASRSSGVDQSWTLGDLSQSSLSWGLEYVYRNLIPLRIGFNDALTFGLGYGQSDSVFSIDYSLLMTALAPQHRFSFSYFFTDSPPQPNSSPELRQYKIVQADVRRYRNRYIAQGKKSLSDRKYDQAVMSFQKAWVLDPLNNDIQSYLERSKEAQQQVVARQRLVEIKKASSGDDFKQMAKAVVDSSSVLPTNNELKNQVTEVRNLLAQSGSIPVIFFDYSRNLEIDQIHDAYHARLNEKDVKKAREMVLRAKTLYPESPVATHVIDDLATNEKKQFDEWLDQANVAISKGNDLRANYCFLKARQIFPDNNDLKKQWSNFTSSYLSRGRYQTFDTLYQDQLYKVAALHFVKDEPHPCIEQLKELFRKNVVHTEGNLFMEFLLDEKMLTEEELSNEKSPQVGLVHQDALGR